MIFSIIHKTIYKYDNNVTYCHNLAILKPKLFSGQNVLEYNLDITPTPTVKKDNIDFFGNDVTHFSIEKQHKELIVTAVSKVDRSYKLQHNDFTSEACKSITLAEALVKLNSLEPEIIDAKQFLLDSVLIKNISSTIHDYAKVSFKKDRSVFEAANDLMKRIFTEFKFDSTFSTIATPIQEVMEAPTPRDGGI